MANGDDEWARRYPLPHERMVPAALLDEARAIARRLVASNRDLHGALHTLLYPNNEEQIARALAAMDAAKKLRGEVDALAWAKDDV